MSVRIVKFLTVAALGGVISSGIAPVAQAQQMVCGKRDSIIAQLEKKYGETRRSLGLQQGRGVIEVYASAETGSWTILVTDTRGTSCLMAAGEAYQSEKVAEIEQPT